MKTLRPYQQAALDRWKGSPCLPLFFQMRLGKSIVAIRWAELKKPKLVLVVAPLTPLVGWMSELDEEGISWTRWKGGWWVGAEDARWCLITYASLSKNPGIANEAWDAVILDESTAIRNPKSQAAKIALRKLARKKNRAVLTGLPDPESLFDVWTQMAFVMGGSWMGKSNFWKWRDYISSNYGFSWIMSAEQEDAIREQLAADASYLTREAAGLGETKVREIRTAALDPKQRRLCKQIAEDWETDAKEAKQIITVGMWIHKICGGHSPEGVALPCWKYGEVLDLLKGELKGEQVVVWFAYSREMLRMWTLLTEAGISVTYVQGATKLADRVTRRELFQSGNKQVMLINSACGKFGYDLSAADTAIYFSNAWGHELRAQSEDRIVSVMKKRPLLLIDLVTEKSADEDVMKALARKTESSEETARAILNPAIYKAG